MSRNKKIIIAFVIIVVATIGCLYRRASTIPEGGTEKEQTCIDSGGSVKIGWCWKSGENFPNTCLVGTCDCPPGFLNHLLYGRKVKFCDCGPSECFNGERCILFSEGANWQAYTNEEYGFEIRYPNEFNIDDSGGKIRFFSNDDATAEENCKSEEQKLIDKGASFGPTGCKFGVFISILTEREIKENYYDFWSPYNVPNGAHTAAFQLNRDYLPANFAVGIPVANEESKIILFEEYYNTVNEKGILPQILSTFKFLK